MFKKFRLRLLIISKLETLAAKHYILLRHYNNKFLYAVFGVAVFENQTAIGFGLHLFFRVGVMSHSIQGD